MAKRKREINWTDVIFFVLFGLGIIAGLVFAVFQFIWWQECIGQGGVYINGNGMLPSCFRG